MFTISEQAVSVTDPEEKRKRKEKKVSASICAVHGIDEGGGGDNDVHFISREKGPLDWMTHLARELSWMKILNPNSHSNLGFSLIFLHIYACFVLKTHFVLDVLVDSSLFNLRKLSSNFFFLSQTVVLD